MPAATRRRADRFHLDGRQLEDALGAGGAVGEVGDLVGPRRHPVGEIVGRVGELLKPLLVEPVDVAQLGEAVADLAGCHVEGDGGLRGVGGEAFELVGRDAGLRGRGHDLGEAGARQGDLAAHGEDRRADFVDLGDRRVEHLVEIGEGFLELLCRADRCGQHGAHRDGIHQAAAGAVEPGLGVPQRGVDVRRR